MSRANNYAAARFPLIAVRLALTGLDGTDRVA